MPELTLEKRVPTHISTHPVLKFDCPNCGRSLRYTLERFYKAAYPGWNYPRGTLATEHEGKREARILTGYSMFNLCPACQGEIVLSLIPAQWEAVAGRPAEPKRMKYRAGEDYRGDVDYGTPEILRLEVDHA